MQPDAPLTAYLRPGAEPEPVDGAAERFNGNGKSNGRHPGAGEEAAVPNPAAAASRPDAPRPLTELGLEVDARQGRNDLDRELRSLLREAIGGNPRTKWGGAFVLAIGLALNVAGNIVSLYV